MPHLGLVTIVVADYDEAIAFYMDALGFELRQDTRLSAEKRWVVVAPPGARETAVTAGGSRHVVYLLVGGFGGRELRFADDAADPQARILDLGMGRQGVR